MTGPSRYFAAKWQMYIGSHRCWERVKHQQFLTSWRSSIPFTLTYKWTPIIPSLYTVTTERLDLLLYWRVSSSSPVPLKPPWLALNTFSVEGVPPSWVRLYLNYHRLCISFSLILMRPLNAWTTRIENLWFSALSPCRVSLWKTNHVWMYIVEIHIFIQVLRTQVNGPTKKDSSGFRKRWRAIF